ncbi:pseudaminic acid cytidylyltransferase [Marinomonas transparens]|uniref:Pseudaminic acid cytidylyltransferase n=1 Tax=Marinomonas transparens TaxID=2795388 RepID=A0A934MXY2_9GAMM|nr:pseudaminic acid cytidylyltransferase [Marinomonas transparens]MBJ7539814.1 pseudaminic acid cytidylyltransferase [Marinomonas transparens]
MKNTTHKPYRVAVIPARGGSQRIPRKNIRFLHGKPLIAYSIETALETGLFDRVIVSTDDQEIAQVAREHGAETPFLRPVELSDNMTGTTPVMQHTLRYLIAEDKTPDQACLIYATCPLLTIEDLQQGLKNTPKDGFCFSATTFDFPIQRALHTNEKGELAPLFPEHIAKRSQDLVEAIHDAGQFYWASTQSWLNNGEIFGSTSKAFMLPRHRIQDLDTEEDWLRLVQIMHLEGAVN